MEAETGWDFPALDAVALDRVLTDWYSVRSEMSGYWDHHDVILCPVNARPAGVHGATTNWEEIVDNEGKNFSYTIAYNVTGWPAGVVRGGASPEGLPIGVQVVAAPGREDVVVAVLAHLEVALGGFRPPPL
jgi:amidase